VLSVRYHAAPVWLTSNLYGKELRYVESSYFRTLRLIMNDYTGKAQVTASSWDMPPNTWSKFAAASMIMKIWMPLYNMILRNHCE